MVSEDETIVFEPRDHSILPFVSAFGFVGGSCFAKNSYAEGDGIIAATIGNDTKYDSVKISCKSLQTSFST